MNNPLKLSPNKITLDFDPNTGLIPDPSTSSVPAGETGGLTPTLGKTYQVTVVISRVFNICAPNREAALEQAEDYALSNKAVDVYHEVTDSYISEEEKD